MEVLYSFNGFLKAAASACSFGLWWSDCKFLSSLWHDHREAFNSSIYDHSSNYEPLKNMRFIFHILKWKLTWYKYSKDQLWLARHISSAQLCLGLLSHFLYLIEVLGHPFWRSILQLPSQAQLILFHVYTKPWSQTAILYS